MDLGTMLAKCEREQWKVGDLDWTGRPRDMSAEDERAIVQYFTDMAGIERLAAALFAQQAKNADDPQLRKIFQSFVRDEVRHAHAAQMLADFYDVNRLATYQPNPALVKFTPHFVNAVRYLSPEIANAYITGGELILDVALLRSINDHVGDDMSAKAMELINRDESRHIAMDFFMVEHYASEAGRRCAAPPRASKRQQLEATWAFAQMLYHAAPFFQDVFFAPLARVDPSGRRMREAFKRLQLLSLRDGVRERPFWRALYLGRLLFMHPLLGPLVGPVAQRVAGLPDDLMRHLYDAHEEERARRMSLDEMALEAVGLKYRL
jgi:rubrerythrin